ncbi:hypothetical protein [Tardiphaga sp.]|uniref:hypothetical protein n=1 Tax=Tardiphaga sp. TaxID=1926292 RepID=UPI00261861A0|nr:hypothetical protein [Tardiphaga sp.]
MQILLKTGFIHRHRITSGENDDRYFDYELDQFLQSLSIDAEPITQKSAYVMQLRIVAHHAERSLADIIQLIPDRKVRWVGRLPKLKGIEALVLKLDEVKALVRGPTVDGLPAFRQADFSRSRRLFCARSPAAASLKLSGSWIL